MERETQAPWFFRKRFLLFGAVYGVAFFFGNLITPLAGLSREPAFLSLGNSSFYALIPIAFAIGGYAVRVWASSYLAASIVWQQDIQLGELRVSGPYRFTRNPLYLGNFLQAIGIGLLGPWLVTGMLVVLMIAYQLLIISVEERFLEERNGAAYREYKTSVARFVPLPWKIAPDGGQPGNLWDGLRSEKMTAGFAIFATIVAIVLTLLRG